MGIRMADLEIPHDVGVSVEQKMFGSFFVDVDCCRSLMRQMQVFASGSAVLRALLPSATWEPSGLDFIVSKKSLGKHGLLYWYDYLQSEGYFLQSETRDAVDLGDFVCVSF